MPSELSPARIRRGGGVCALLSGASVPADGERVGVIVCGGNTADVRL
jgi:hypothetical protein